MSRILNTTNLTALVIGMSMSASPAKADTSLPYIGPVMADCQVHQPQGPEWEDKDAGYMTDESCKIIYVKPPILGKFIVAEPMFINVQQCPGLDRTRKKIQNDYDRRTVGASPEQLGKEIALLTKNLSLLDQIGSDRTAAYVSAGAILDWNKLINKYRSLNAGKDVRAMPLASGLFSAKRINNKKNQDEYQEEYQNGIDAIRLLEPYGIELPEKMGVVNDMPVPDFLETIKSKSNRPFVMGQSIAMGLELNLAGACMLLDENLNLVKSPSQYMSATYTYFYPVQTKAGFVLNYKIEPLKVEVLELAKQKGGQLTPAQLQEALKQKGLLTININPGAFPGGENRAKELEDKYKEEISEYLAEVVLMNLSAALDVAIKDAYYTDTETHTKKVCSRPWYRFGGKKCSVRQYTVNVQKPDWEKVEAALAPFTQTAESGVSEYRNYYMLDTVAFVPEFSGNKNN